MTQIRDPLTGWARTAQLDLPYVLPAQAQKHVTVNESLALLDSVVQLSVESIPTDEPPADAVDGGRYLVSGLAHGAWAGRAGMLAIRRDDDWVYVTPRRGWIAWVGDSRFWMVYDGALWRYGPRRTVLARSDGGSITLARIVEGEHVIEAGATSSTTLKIPSRTTLLGVSGAVTEVITGPGSFDIGVADAGERFGQRISGTAGARFSTLEESPRTYPSDTPLLLTANDEPFTGGRVRLALHLLQLAYEIDGDVVLPFRSTRSSKPRRP